MSYLRLLGEPGVLKGLINKSDKERRLLLTRRQARNDCGKE